MTKEDKQRIAEEKAEERRSKKAFNYLVSMAQKKGALVAVKIINR